MTAGLDAMTNEEILALDTATLRALAEKELDPHFHLRDLASLPFNDETLASPGGLTTLDLMVHTLMAVYAAHGPRAVRRYDTVDIKIFGTDEALRDQLIRHRDMRRLGVVHPPIETGIGPVQ